MHFDYLDSLRGLAALSVVFLHLGLASDYPALFANIPGYIFVAGSAAVAIFFIHSSFVLSYKYVGTPDCKLKILEAIIKRPFRLVGVVMIATYLPLIHNRNIIGRPEGDTFILGPILHPFTFGVQWNGPLWTIHTELIGSFLTFGLVLLICGFKKELRMMIMLVLMVFLRETFYFAFIFGIIVADFHKNWSVAWFIKYRTLISWILFVPAFLLVAWSPKSPANLWFQAHVINLEYGFVMIGSMLMFVTVCTNSFIQKILHYNRFLFLGKISYSMYATHMPIAAFVNSVIIGRFLCWHFEATPLFRFIIIMPIILLIAWVVDKYVDKPCIKLAGKIGKWGVSMLIAMSKSINYITRACLGMNVATSSESQDQ